MYCQVAFHRGWYNGPSKLYDLTHHNWYRTQISGTTWECQGPDKISFTSFKAPTGLGPEKASI